MKNSKLFACNSVILFILFIMCKTVNAETINHTFNHTYEIPIGTTYTEVKNYMNTRTDCSFLGESAKKDDKSTLKNIGYFENIGNKMGLITFDFLDDYLYRVSLTTSGNDIFLKNAYKYFFDLYTNKYGKGTITYNDIYQITHWNELNIELKILDNPFQGNKRFDTDNGRFLYFYPHILVLVNRDLTKEIEANTVAEMIKQQKR